jgi:hypothetical protein
MGKKFDPDPGRTTRIKFPSLKTIFRVKILKFFDADPGWKKFWSATEKFWSGINKPDPQHWFFGYVFLPSSRIYAVQLWALELTASAQKNWTLTSVQIPLHLTSNTEV